MLREPFARLHYQGTVVLLAEAPRVAADVAEASADPRDAIRQLLGLLSALSEALAHSEPLGAST
jgi:hypothetical protein